MSRARQLQRSIRWARYANHYAHIHQVGVGGWGYVRALNYGYRREASWGKHWRAVRRQAKRRLGEGRNS